jgi:pilus assembly protein CpaD
MSATTNRIERARRQLFLGVAAITLAIVSGGCDQLNNEMAADLNVSSKRHPIAYTSNAESLFVEIAPETKGLSANQEADVYRFVQRYKAESNGPLRVAAPKSVAGHLASTGMMRQIEQIILGAGVDPSALERSRYSGVAPAGAPLELSYDRTIALAPQCADWGSNLGENRERLPYNDFGCATQRNLALAVANARDIQVPREETQRSSERRSSTWTKYISGDAGGGAQNSTPAAAPAPAPAPAP